MPKVIEGRLDARELKVGIVVSRFNSFIGERLVEGALDALLRHGAEREHLVVVRVPGAFEIPLAAQKMAATGRYDALICLGAVIRGATPHFDYLAAEVTKCLAQIMLEGPAPVINGVIVADTPLMTGAGPSSMICARHLVTSAAR